MSPITLARITLLTAVAVLVDAAPRRASIPRDSQDPFAPIDPQEWVNPDDMTWDDWKPVPGIDWSDPTRRGSIQNWNIALVTVDYSDMPFVITQAANSTIFTNPQPAANGIPRESVPAFYRDLLNTPQPLNRKHTLHEYWMQDSFGRYGVNLTAYGPYRLPQKYFQYGATSRFNSGACPAGSTCAADLRTDTLAAWRKDVGTSVVNSYKLAFIMSAGQDESSTWQEFGEMKFASPEDVPREWGPPARTSGAGGGNWAHTRYVNWTSWASASTIWPDAGGGTSVQAESSGMAVYAHELSHLLDIGDNYGNPYDTKEVWRDFAGPFSIMARGSFNGPGGAHQRWQIPALQGSSLGSLHTVRDKLKIGLVDKKNVLELSRETLAKDAVVVRTVTSRAVDPGNGLIGIYVTMDKDRSKACARTDPMCDRGNYQLYTVEVVDRMGADSFQPDHGVFITKARKSDTLPYQWAIDANPQDINITDFVSPKTGKEVKITLGDYRQLLDALFHAGTRSGSKYEHIDTDNRLHFYILSTQRDEKGILSYDIGIRSLDSADGSAAGTALGVSLGPGSVVAGGAATDKGVLCSFPLNNTGSGSESDVFRLKAQVKSGKGWRVALPTEVVAVKFGQQKEVRVAVAAAANADAEAVVELVSTSELKASITATALCRVNK